MLQTEAVQKLQAFAENNQVTTGKFTIGDEKAHNVFMRVEVSCLARVTVNMAHEYVGPRGSESYGPD